MCKIDYNHISRYRKPFVSVVGVSYAGKQHVYDITVPGPARFSANGLIAHNCESYVFGGAEYANAAHGAARIVYGNGNPPVVTNPMLVPFLCKHLVATATIMFKTNL